jgi:peptidase A4-like protein
MTNDIPGDLARPGGASAPSGAPASANGPTARPARSGWLGAAATALLALNLALFGLARPAQALPGGLPARLSRMPLALAEQPSTISAEATIQAVIARADAEQAAAIAARDPAPMADTATSAHYQSLIAVNQELLAHGVTAINLDHLDWGPITISGRGATATADETWTTSYADGTVEQSLDRNLYTLVQDGGVWKIADDDHPAGASPGSGATPPAPLPQPPTAALEPGQDTSRNWSGYAADNGSFSGVTGTWTVPQPALQGPFGSNAVWVGIGGVRGHDLIQAGTATLVSGSGQARLQAWVELLPEAARPIALAVHPGDSVTATISEQAANSWLIDFVDNTTGQRVQQTASYASSHSSAEWVVEAPTDGQSVLPLDNFGTVGFSNGSAILNGQSVSIAEAGAQPITLISARAQALAVPSALGDGGLTFDVTRTTVPANGPSGATPGRPRGRRGPG